MFCWSSIGRCDYVFNLQSHIFFKSLANIGNKRTHKLFDSKCCVLGFISPLERVQRVCEAG